MYMHATGHATATNRITFAFHFRPLFKSITWEIFSVSGKNTITKITARQLRIK